MSWLLDPSRCLTLDEAQRFVQFARTMAEGGRAAGDFRRARDGHLTLFLFGTGCRVSEALGATLGDVRSPGGGRVYADLVNLKHDEGDRKTTVPLSRTSGDELREWRAWLAEQGAPAGCPLFSRVAPTPAAPLPPALTRQAVRKNIRRDLRAVGIDRPGVAVHAIRHVVGVATLKASKNLRAVQARLRHRRASTTEVYAQLTTDDFHAAVDGAQELFEGGGGREPDDHNNEER